jgi:hypothetical protein
MSQCDTEKDENAPLSPFFKEGGKAKPFRGISGGIFR